MSVKRERNVWFANILKRKRGYVKNEFLAYPLFCASHIYKILKLRNHHQ